jgi:hypothetical protein
MMADGRLVDFALESKSVSLIHSRVSRRRLSIINGCKDRAVTAIPSTPYCPRSACAKDWTWRRPSRRLALIHQSRQGFAVLMVRSRCRQPVSALRLLVCPLAERSHCQFVISKAVHRDLRQLKCFQHSILETLVGFKLRFTHMR